MNHLPILIIFVFVIVLILFSVLKRNRKDEKDFEKNLNVIEDEEVLRSKTRPGEKETL